MKSYTTVMAEFVDLISTKQPDGSMVIENKTCKKDFVEVINHSTDKTLDGSSMRIKRGIKIKVFSSICQFIKPNMNLIIDCVVYGNLEVTPIVGTKVYVQIDAWA